MYFKMIKFSLRNASQRDYRPAFRDYRLMEQPQGKIPHGLIRQPRLLSLRKKNICNSIIYKNLEVRFSLAIRNAFSE